MLGRRGQSGNLAEVHIESQRRDGGRIAAVDGDRVVGVGDEIPLAVERNQAGADGDRRGAVRRLVGGGIGVPAERIGGAGRALQVHGDPHVAGDAQGIVNDGVGGGAFADRGLVLTEREIHRTRAGGRGQVDVADGDVHAVRDAVIADDADHPAVDIGAGIDISVDLSGFGGVAGRRNSVGRRALLNAHRFGKESEQIIDGRVSVGRRGRLQRIQHGDPQVLFSQLASGRFFARKLHDARARKNVLVVRAPDVVQQIDQSGLAGGGRSVEIQHFRRIGGAGVEGYVGDVIGVILVGIIEIDPIDFDILADSSDNRRIISIDHVLRPIVGIGIGERQRGKMHVAVLDVDSGERVAGAADGAVGVGVGDVIRVIAAERVIGDGRRARRLRAVVFVNRHYGCGRGDGSGNGDRVQYLERTRGAGRGTINVAELIRSRIEAVQRQEHRIVARQGNRRLDRRSRIGALRYIRGRIGIAEGDLIKIIPRHSPGPAVRAPVVAAPIATVGEISGVSTLTGRE